VTPARAAARIVAEGLKIGVNLGKRVPCEALPDNACKTDAAWRKEAQAGCSSFRPRSSS